MEYSLVAPKTFVLKLNIHCKGCETKLKKLLLSIQGVHSVGINAKEGNVTIKGTIDPPTIIMMLEKYGRKAELLWEQSPSKDGDSLQIIAESKVVDQLDDPKMVEQLQQLSGIKDLKNVQVTYSKTIKLTFNGQKNNRSKKDEDLEVTTKDTVYSPQLPHGGRPCVASASCCGGHGMHNSHGHHGCCQIHGTCPVHSSACAIHNNNWNWPPPACGCMSPLEPAPSWPINYPSAPPLPSVYNPPPPPPPPPSPSQPTGYSYSSMFSDDNATGCVII